MDEVIRVLRELDHPQIPDYLEHFPLGQGKRQRHYLVQQFMEGERFVLISHAPDSDSWWNTIKNAIQVGGDQMGVTVEYRNPPTGDLADMARIVEQTLLNAGPSA